MVVAGDHVLGAEVEKRHQAALLHERAVGGGDTVRRQAGHGNHAHEPDDGRGPTDDARHRRERAYFEVGAAPSSIVVAFSCSTSFTFTVTGGDDDAHAGLDVGDLHRLLAFSTLVSA